MPTKKQLTQILTLSALFLLPALVLPFFQAEQNTTEELASNAISGANYFEGKTIEWVIPFKEGGGGDTWARSFWIYSCYDNG